MVFSFLWIEKLDFEITKNKILEEKIQKLKIKIKKLKGELIKFRSEKILDESQKEATKILDIKFDKQDDEKSNPNLIIQNENVNKEKNDDDKKLNDLVDIRI